MPLESLPSTSSRAIWISRGSLSSDTVALKYSNGANGLDSVVRFRWNGSGVELIGNTG